MERLFLPVQRAYSILGGKTILFGISAYVSSPNFFTLWSGESLYPYLPLVFSLIPCYISSTGNTGGATPSLRSSVFRSLMRNGWLIVKVRGIHSYFHTLPMVQLTRNFLSTSHQTLEEKNSMRAVNTSRQLPAWRLLAIWANIGCLSFGGGASSILLIRRTFVEQDCLFTPEEFSRDWNISQVTPGVTQLAVSILIGRKIGGVWGAVASFTGLLLPSAAITCLLASVFFTLERLPIVASMLGGIVPATAGMMCWLALEFSQP